MTGSKPMPEHKTRRCAMPLPVQMLIGLVVGLGIGLVWPEFGKQLRPIGTAFVLGIQMIVIPIVFSAVTLGVYRMGSEIKALGRVATVCLIYFYLATIISVAIGLGLNGLFHPGIGSDLVATGKLPPNLAASVNWAQFLLDMIPSNIVAAMAGQKIMPTLVFAILFGAGLASSGETAAPLVRGLEALLNAMFRMTQWITATAPLAIAAIVAWLFADQGLKTVIALAKLIGVLYIGLAVLVVVFGIVLLLIGQRPIAITRQMMEPVILAFATRSSEVALPVHMAKLKAMGVPNRIVSVVLPLGYAFNRDASMVYFALAVTFLADAYRVPLSWSALLTIFITTAIASKGTANVPSGGLVAVAMVLTTVGLPVESLAIIAGVDAFMDMGRSAINVLGNTVAVMLVQKFGGAAGAVEAILPSPADAPQPG